MSDLMPIQRALGAVLHDNAALVEEMSAIKQILQQIAQKANNDGTVLFSLIKLLTTKEIVTEDEMNEAFSEQMKFIQEELQKSIKEQANKPELVVPEKKIIVPR